MPSHRHSSHSSKPPPPVDAVVAFEDLQEMLGDLEDHGAMHDELDLLNEVLGDPEYHALGMMYDVLTSKLPDAKDENASDVLHDTIEIIEANAHYSKKAKDLLDILEKPHLMSLIYAHDDIARKLYDEVFADSLELVAPPPEVFDMVGEQHRYVTIRKNGKQPLGITVRLDEDQNLVVARILQDSLADKQKLLQVGQVIKEVNGIAVFVPEDLMIVLKETEDSLTFKTLPPPGERIHSKPIYVKACFNYDPLADRLIPCKKAGLPFREGDILQVVDTNDENWWQARITGLANAPVGLIPSRTLQEKRSAYVQPELTKTKTNLLCGIKAKRKKRITYKSSETTDFDNCDIRVYEQVVRSKGHRSTLVLVGARGVGKRSLKERLVRENPGKYGAAIPHTSRPPKSNEKNGIGYYFIDGNLFEAEIKKNLYIDHGEFGGFLYGTRLSSIKEVIDSGRICVLDISARSLKFLQSAEFKPLVIFIASPSVEALKVMYSEGKKRRDNNNARELDFRNELFQEERFIRTLKESREMEKSYNGMYDELIVNDDFDRTYDNICQIMEEEERHHKWIPVDWNDDIDDD